MAGDVDVDIDINIENNTSWELNEITNNVVHLHQAVQREEKQNNRWAQSVKRMAAAALGAARAVARVAASVAAVAAAVGPATSGLLAAGKAIAAFGKASARLTPLLSFIPAFIAGFALIKLTLKQAAPGLAKAFEPITRQFVDAKGEATALAKTLQRVVGIDVRPAAAAFVKINFPAVAHAMERIAYQTNLVVAGFMNWTNSTRGVESIKALSKGTADLFTRLAPHVVATATAFGDLAGRAADPAFKKLGDAIAGILDRLRAWANNTSVEDINRAMSDLAGYGKKLQTTWTTVKDIGRWLAEHQGVIKHFSDVAAGAAVALGVATGNLPAIVGGAATLVINHWSQLKQPFTDAIGWVKNMADAWQRDAGRIRIAEAITKALQAGKDAFQDMIKDIGPKWSAFIAQVKAAWQEWSPLIAAWWETGGKQTFQAVGVALGLFVLALLSAATAGAAFAKVIAEAFKWMVGFVLGVLQTLLNGAAKAFSWVPGLNVQLKVAAEQFNKFRDDVNRSLNGIESIKTIRINASVYVTGNNSSSGGVDQRTGNSRNAGLSALTSWQRVSAALSGAAQSGGTSRTGGARPLTATVNNTVLLDGRPFRSYTDRTVLESERRSAWRDQNRRDR